MSSAASVTAFVLPPAAALGDAQPAWGLLAGALAVTAALVFAARAWAPRGERVEPSISAADTVVSPRTRWVLAALLVLATALRLHELGRGLSFDEIDTLVHYARRPLAEIATTFDSQNQHLLYSLCARVAVLVFDDEAYAVRLPAVVFGVASIWALWRFARLVTGEREALFAAALLAVSYHHIWFSQNARGYTGLLFFTLLGSASFVRMLQQREPRGIAQPLAYGLSMALAAWMHATAVIVVAAHCVVWLALVARHRQRPIHRQQPFWSFPFATSFTLTLYALVLPQFVDTLLAPTLPGATTEWKDPLWLAREILAGLARGVPGGTATVVAGVVLAAIGLVSYARQSLALIAIFVLAPLLMAAALIATHHNLWPRMFFFAAGFAVLIALRGVVESVRFVARGALRARLGAATTAALVAVCAASAASLRHVWAPKQDFAGAVAFLDTELRDGDAVATVGMTTLPCAELYGKKWPAVDNADALASLEALHERTWIVYTTPTHMQAEFPDVLQHIAAHYREARVFWGTLAGCEVIVAVREG